MLGETYQNLPPDQRDFIRLFLLQTLEKLSLFEIGFLQNHFSHTCNYEQFIEVMKSQQRDDPQTMARIIGERAAGLLEKL